MLGLKAVALLAVVLGFACTIESHICIMDPAQRGGYDVSDPGDPSCFAPNAPCGAGNPWWSRPVGSPTATLLGGSTYRVHFQQNLNHYNVGHPGYLKLAWSCGVNQTSDMQFTDLTGVPDYWAHWQSTQTNFSLAVSVPNVNCPLATLQGMYHPNKPEEPIFHQCSTIAIAKTADVKRIASGQLTSLFDDGNTFASIALNDGSIGKLQASAAEFIPLAGTEALDPVSKTGYYLAASTLGGVPAYIRSIPNLLVGFSFPDARTDGRFGRPMSLITPSLPSGNSSFQWVAVAGVVRTSTAAAPAGSVLLLAMLGSSNSDYWYQLYSFNPAQPTTLPVLLATSANLNANDTGFVNFLWTVFDPDTQTVSVLTGDENANADPLNAAFVQFFLPGLGSTSPVSATFAILDVSAYTFQSFTSIGGKLYALSPGLVGDSGPYGTHQWAVVSFSGSSGAILSAAPLVAVAAPGSTALSYLPDLLGRYQGGIHNGITNEGLLVSLFYRTEDAQPLLTFVNPLTGAVVWSTYLNGNGLPASLLYTV